MAPIFMKPEDVELLKMSLVAMELFSFSYLFGWIDMIVFSFFTSIEKPMLSLFISLLGTLVFPVVAFVVMTNFWGLMEYDCRLQYQVF